MSNATDMSTPVTRGELREQLEKLATKADLEMWGGALLARIESGEQRLIQRIESGEQRLIQRIEQVEQELRADLARHTQASYESMLGAIAVIEEKYADLPGRVNRLESTVFVPER